MKEWESGEGVEVLRFLELGAGYAKLTWDSCGSVECIRLLLWW